MPQNKNPIQQQIEQERVKSKTASLTSREIAQKVGNLARAQALARDDVRQRISESVRSSEAYKTGLAQRDQSFRDDPEFQKKHKKKMQALRSDPEFVERHRRSIQELRADPKRSQELNRKSLAALEKAKETEEYWENYYKGIEKRDSDPEYHKRRIKASIEKIAVKISTPQGEFDSISSAARHHNLTSEGMRYRVNSDKYPDYKKIEK